MGAYKKPCEEAEIRRKLEPIAKQIADSDNGINYFQVKRLLSAVKSNLTTLSYYYPVYEEERMVVQWGNKKVKRTFICMLKK